MIPLIIAFFHVLGALTSVRAILKVRTAQGAIAWAVSLNTFPYLAVPAYWVFGRSTFEGYVLLRRESWRTNRKRVHRVYRLDGLQHAGASAQAVGFASWSCALANGRRTALEYRFRPRSTARWRAFGILTEIDQWSRESVSVGAGF